MILKFKSLDEEIRKRLDKLFGVENCLIEIHPGNILLPPKYADIGEQILNLEVKPDDIWLVSYPRTGSTWTQEIVWLLVNNLDYEKAKLMTQFRAPLLELTAIFGNDTRSWKNELGNSVEQVENMPSPRCIKSHLPWELLPKQLDVVKPKIIYVVRNPKDVCVSYYHYSNLLHNFHGIFDDFCELFLQGNVAVGSIWDHVTEFWKRREEPNVLVLKYEDMKKNHKEAILKISKFLGKTYSNDEINGLLEHSSFSKMRENPSINLEPILDSIYNPGERQNGNRFIRKGQVGDWQNYMNDEIAKKFYEMNEKKWTQIGLTWDTD